MEITVAQKVFCEARFRALETLVAQLSAAIKQFNQERGEVVAQRDACLKQIAEARARLGIETVLQ